MKFKRGSTKRGDLIKAYAELQFALNAPFVEFPEIRLVIVRPELSSHNANVRELLKQLKIDFQVEYQRTGINQDYD
jgi:hypothetical protein